MYVTTLETLPNELLAKVLKHLNPKDIPAVRLTSKHMQISVSNRFIREFIRCQRIMMSRKSLQTFLQVCSHPVFGPMIEEVALTSCRISESGFDALALSVVAKKRGSGVWGYNYWWVGEEEMALARQELCAYGRRFEEEIRLQDSGEALDLLSAAFSLRAQCGRAITLILDDSLSNCLGGKTHSQGIDIRHWKHAREAAFRLLVLVASKSKLKVRVFSFVADQEDHGTQDNEERTGCELDLTQEDSQLNDDMLAAFLSGLDAVSLQFSKRAQLSSRTVNSVARLQFLAKKSRSLILSLGVEMLYRIGDDSQQEPRYTAFRTIAEAPNSTNLRKISLQLLAGSEDIFKMFLSRRRDKLRLLHLHFCILRLGGR